MYVKSRKLARHSRKCLISLIVCNTSWKIFQENLALQKLLKYYVGIYLLSIILISHTWSRISWLIVDTVPLGPPQCYNAPEFLLRWMSQNQMNMLQLRRTLKTKPGSAWQQANETEVTSRYVRLYHLNIKPMIL